MHENAIHLNTGNIVDDIYNLEILLYPGPQSMLKLGTKVLNLRHNSLESFSHPNEMSIRRCGLIIRAGM